MNVLVENKIISEMNCGSNLSFILNDNSMFQLTDYKVLHSQKDSCFIKCMKMLYNGKIQLYYFTSELKPLSMLIKSLNENTFLTILSNFLSSIISVKSNGFLCCKNIDASFNHIYVDPNTYKVSLIYLPLNEHLFESDAMFENEIKVSLIKLLSASSPLTSSKVSQIISELQNGTFNIEDIYSKINGMRLLHRTEINQSTKFDLPMPKLKLISINSSIPINLFVNSKEYFIGKKSSNNGVIAFNSMISRVHCKISAVEKNFFITDLQSSNGTFINYSKLSPNQMYPIKNNDIVRIANLEFRVVID